MAYKSMLLMCFFCNSRQKFLFLNLFFFKSGYKIHLIILNSFFEVNVHNTKCTTLYKYNYIKFLAKNCLFKAIQTKSNTLKIIKLIYSSLLC